MGKPKKTLMKNYEEITQNPTSKLAKSLGTQVLHRAHKQKKVKRFL